MNILIDERRKPAAGHCKLLHRLDFIFSRETVIIEICRPIDKLDLDEILTDLIGNDTGITAKILITLHDIDFNKAIV